MTHSLTARLALLPATDKRLLKAVFGAALLALGLGILFGALTALARAGWLDAYPETAYRLLTLHGVSIFFYWLYFAQAGLLLAFASAQGSGRISWRPAAWAGFALMTAGFLFSEAASLTGAIPLLYDGSPELAREEPGNVAAFALGYDLLGLGLMVVAASAVATVLGPRWKGEQPALTAVGFAVFAWAGFLMVSGIAAIHAFLPPVLWALGLGAFPADHGTGWHILFHNLHYLPLMATVLVWYVLVEALTGVKSVFGARFSKIVFSAYLVFVPPTSLYHMFLEPDLPETVRVAGSLLSLFVSVPTLTAFLIIVSSLEINARARGANGLFGWLKQLPWQHPAMAAMGMAVVNLGLGIVFAFVLIQEKLAPLLSDTFFVPGYFHFFTVGTVSLTFLAAFAVILPELGGRLWRPDMLKKLPVLATLGLLIFGASGIAAGYAGVPRRVFDVSYGGEAPTLWQGLMAGVGIGGSIMALALAVFAFGMAVTLLRGSRKEEKAAASFLDWSGRPKALTAAWMGPASVGAIVAAMYGFTAFAFELLQRLPIAATGGGGH